MKRLPGSSDEIQAASPSSKVRELSGRKMVLAMFLFGGMTTAGLWLYWYYHYAPFRPLQEAIVAEFPGSAPRVEGGQRKMHQHTPKILRITLQVKFDPNVRVARAEGVAQRLEELIRRHQDLSAYDKLEMYLFQRIPEREFHEKLFERDLVHERDLGRE